jgi:hypothetical protein
MLSVETPFSLEETMRKWNWECDNRERQLIATSTATQLA